MCPLPSPEEAGVSRKTHPSSIPIITGSVWTKGRTSSSRGSTQFILSAIFNKPIKVVKIDKAATDFYIRLTNLQSDYRRVGVNYNQTVKAIHSGELTEKKALALLYKLEQLTVEYISLNKEIIRLTKEFERWLQR